MKRRPSAPPSSGLNAKLRREDGQSVIFVAVCMVVLLGFLGLVLDVGKIYIAQRNLQTATDAAVLAAAQDLPDATTAFTTACQYSASDGTVTGDQCHGIAGKNAEGMTSVQTTLTPECLSFATTGIKCIVSSSCPVGTAIGPSGTTAGGCNAIKMTETASVAPWILGILNVGPQTVSATATASMAGGAATPLDVEMINDTTASMANGDSCGGTPTDVPSTVSLTQEDCAKAGIRALLTNLEPCQPSLSSCDPQSAVADNIPSANQLDEVGMVTFPGLTSGFTTGTGISQELNCSKDLSSGNVSYASNANYQIVPFSSDYRYSDSSTTDPLATLYPTSKLVQSVYWAGDGCPNGGYPINSGGSITSISGGASSDMTTANNNSPAIAGGSSTAANSASTVNAGITQGLSQEAPTTPPGVVDGTAANGSPPTVNATVMQTIGGGPSGTSSDRSPATSSTSSITFSQLPSSTAAGDFLLATITGQAAGLTGSSSICAPANWTPVNKTVSTGTSGTPLIQETFSGFKENTGGVGASNVFSFYSGACGVGAIALNASGSIVRYPNVTGVDQGASAVASASGGPTNSNGSAGSTAWAIGGPAGGTDTTTTTWSGTSAAPQYVSLSGNCTPVTTVNGTCNNATAPGAGTITAIGFTFTSGATNSSTKYTVTLVKNQVATGVTCTVGFSSSTCGSSSGSVAVAAGDKLELSVARTAGATNVSGKSSETATETGTTNEYVSLSTACVNASSATCNVTSAVAGTLSSATFTYGATVPANDSATVTLYKNAATTGFTCTIAAGASSCSITNALALVATDKLELLVTTTGTAAFTATATTALVINGLTVTAPGVTTTQANDLVVRLYGTGSNGFSAGTFGFTPIVSSSTALGEAAAAQATAGGAPANAATTATSNSADSWVAQTISLTPAPPSSIAINAPLGYSGGGNDLMLVTIAVQSLGGNVICAPTTGGAWTPLPARQGLTVSTTWSSGSGTGQVTQESFYTMAPSPGTLFTFASACGGSGNPFPAGASEVTTNYSGVDSTTPLDGVTAGATTGAASPLNPTASVTPNSVDDEVVGLFATDSTSITATGTGAVNENGTFTSSGVSFKLQSSPTATTPPTATSAPTAAAWTEETVALRAALPSTISFTNPFSGYSAASADFLLASISAQGLGSGGICTSASNWNFLAKTTTGSGATQITQETFYTTSGSEKPTFTFSAAINSAGVCSGASLSAAATGVETLYSGADVVDPPIVSVTPTNNPAGTALTAPQVTTTTNDSEVVSFFTTDDDFSGGSQPSPQTPNSDFTNTGEANAVQESAGLSTQATATSGNSAFWAAQTIALTPLLSSSITVTPPTGYVTGSGDLMLVSIAAQGLGSGTICAPDSSWTAVPVSVSSNTTTSGTLTQEAFWTNSSTASSDVFTFYPGTKCNGTPSNVPASAVATVYTGVDPTTPIDTTYAVSASGTSSPLHAAAITPTGAGDEIVALFGTNAATLTGTSANATSTGGVTSSGVNDSLDAGTTSYTPPGTVTSTPTAENWTAETVALKPLGTNGVTIARPASPTSNDLVLVAVTAKSLATGATICAPNDGTWTQEGSLVRQGAGALAQALFYSARTSTSAESYTFTFRTGSCPSGGSTSASAATALAVRYTGVNPITPIDNNGTTDVYGSASGSGTSVKPPATTALHTGDFQVAFYGTGATSISGVDSPVATGASSATGHTDTSLGTTVTSVTPPTGTTSSANWIGQTVNLEAASSACSSCYYGAEDPGGVGTDYGLAISAAETALDSQAAAPGLGRANAQKVIILLSDGDANTQDGGLTNNPCQYGIWAAEQAEQTAASNASDGNTWFFSVAYGADYSANGSCTYDTGTGKNGENLSTNLNAQCAMQLMADNKVTNPSAYSTDAQAKAAICSTSHASSDPTHRFYTEAVNSSLEDVFQQIAEQATSARLVSNNAT